MGHRALLAYRRDDAETDSTDAGTASADRDARYDIHRSHWGGDDFALLRHVSPDAPFAAATHFAVDPDPVATDCSLAEIVADHLDFLRHEAFYLVSGDYRPTAFHVFWFGLETDADAVAESPTVGHGALVEASPADPDYFRGWFRGTKALAGDLVDDGALDREAALDALRERVETWRGDREVILPDSPAASVPSNSRDSRESGDSSPARHGPL